LINNEQTMEIVIHKPSWKLERCLEYPIQDIKIWLWNTSWKVCIQTQRWLLSTIINWFTPKIWICSLLWL